MKSRRDILKSSRHKKLLEKRKVFAVWGAAMIAVFFMLTGVLAWLSGNEKVVIAEIEARGNSVVPGEEIVSMVQREIAGKYLGLFHKNNSFLYPQSAILERILSEQKRISDVNIYLDNLALLVVSVTERKPAYLWCGNEYSEEENKEACFFMDSDGYIFAEAPYFSGDVFFEWYGPTEEKNGNPIGDRFLPYIEFKKLVSFREAISALGLKTTHMTAKTDGDYALSLKDSGSILFNSDQEFDALLGNLDSAISALASYKNLEYVDLRFGNKIFYRYK
ncbi:MAG: hypothetical protein NUV42_00465 [Candidatus Yonathbacteria bacterium]|nr:hypothetical protein [Candidatus Yonathbacteria bacterium]